MAIEGNENVFQGVRRLESFVVLTKVKGQGFGKRTCQVANYFERFKCQGRTILREYQKRSLQEQVTLGILILTLLLQVRTCHQERGEDALRFGNIGM